MTEELVEFIREEQAFLWHDLHEAVRSALNGAWSIRAGSIAVRIVQAARLVGPTPHDEMPYELVAGGVYEAVLAAGGIEAPLPDETEWQRLDAMMEKYKTTRARCTPALAATVAAIKEPREMAFISDGGR